MAVWFLALDFENRLHRAFALFLFLRGLANVGTGFRNVPDLNPYWSAATPYFGVALPFAVLYFAYVYRIHRAGALRRAHVLPVLLGAAALCEILYARHQRVADRFADSALPHAKPIAKMSHPERVSLFREQLLIAWADGSLSTKERRMLLLSRERLGLSLDESARMEQEVVKGLNVKA